MKKKGFFVKCQGGEGFTYLILISFCRSKIILLIHGLNPEFWEPKNRLPLFYTHFYSWLSVTALPVTLTIF